jgi:hypothetical protein
MDLLNDSLRLWAHHREFKAVLAELATRSDAELAEMGIARSDVVRLAFEEAERRILAPAARGADAAPRAPVLGQYRLRGA